MTTSISNLPVIIDNEGIKTNNLSEKEDNYISEGGGSNGSESRNNASRSGRDKLPPIINMAYEYSDNGIDIK